MRSLAKSMVQEWDLSHPPTMQPEDLLYFVYLDEFVDDWRNLFPNDKDEISLWALEILIMSNPTEAPVVPGTGGLRKMRFTDDSTDTGKSGGARICYAYFPEYCIVLMVMAYAKNAMETLTNDQKAGIKRFLAKANKWLADHSP